MIMRWHVAVAGLAVTLLVGVSVTRYMAHREPDLGLMTHINLAGYQDSEHAERAFELFVDFDQSMQSELYESRYKSQGLGQLLDYFRAMYNKSSFFQVTPQQALKIPKLFHYVWFGKKLPKEYLSYLESWKVQHPEWIFVHWVDNPENYDLGTVMSGCSFEELQNALACNALPAKEVVIDVRGLKFDNKIFFDEATNYGEKSDIMKWEVVYRFGGAYIDVDFECLKPFDMLHHMYDFYTGIQPLDTNLVQLGAALFAAVPGHPILKHCVETIKLNRDKQQIILKTGPLHFTKSFLAQAGGHPEYVEVALPASYFYPCGYEQKKQPREAWIRPESFAVHHWAGSWLTADGFEQ